MVHLLTHSSSRCTTHEQVEAYRCCCFPSIPLLISPSTPFQKTSCAYIILNVMNVITWMCKSMQFNKSCGCVCAFHNFSSLALFLFLNTAWFPRWFQTKYQALLPNQVYGRFWILFLCITESDERQRTGYTYQAMIRIWADSFSRSQSLALLMK